MIDAKELRIGNYISHDKLGVFTVEGIQPWHIWGSIQPGMLYYEACTPIPLTEEWLLKLGFIENLESDWHRDYKWDEYILTTPKYTIEIRDFNGNGFICEQLQGFGDEDILITSVHQLQNLLFCTIGHELTINESNG